ncbi:hypothetical protein V2J09_014608 [Rumex salicifolius]
MTHQFLIGLNDAVFGTLRSNILAQDPFPDLNKVYALVVQEERHRSLITSRESPDAVAMAARRPLSALAPARVDRKYLQCTHCGRFGHDHSTCFKLHGVPECVQERRAERAATAAATKTTAAPPTAPPTSGRGAGRERQRLLS